VKTGPLGSLLPLRLRRSLAAVSGGAWGASGGRYVMVTFRFLDIVWMGLLFVLCWRQKLDYVVNYCVVNIESAPQLERATLPFSRRWGPILELSFSPTLAALDSPAPVPHGAEPNSTPCLASRSLTLGT
jgi:hypothetical protein